MVADLQHVRMGDDAGLQQGILFREFHIACQQDASAAAFRQQHQGIVVFQLLVLFQRADDRQFSAVQRQFIPGEEEAVGVIRLFDRLFHRVLSVFLFQGVISGSIDVLHNDFRFQQRLQPAGVVRVGMGQDDAGESGNSFLPQGVQQHVGVFLHPCINQVGALSAAQQQRVRLAYVDGHQGHFRSFRRFSAACGEEHGKKQDRCQQYLLHSFPPSGRLSLKKRFSSSLHSSPASDCSQTVCP